jgi:hypothetical protein
LSKPPQKQMDKFIEYSLFIGRDVIEISLILQNAPVYNSSEKEGKIFIDAHTLISLLEKNR